ncbi:MAG: bacteriohemerythrin [Pseudomonadota bacterium]|nr:bacteriohemerythrin [Pseudomonadota bacterium]
MNNRTTMLLLLLSLGTLLVAAVLTFIALGAGNPIPWILVALAVAIPAFSNWREKRHFVTWNRDLSVGIELIDEDHQKLFNLINQLHTAVYYYTGEAFEKQALDDLVAYTQYHFQREEDLMEKHGYPEFEAHRKEHREMIAQVEQFLRDYEKRGHETLKEMANYLKSWLISHISDTDQRYSGFLREKGVR